MLTTNREKQHPASGWQGTQFEKEKVL